MAFNSISFLASLPLVLLAYWLLPQRFRWILLLIASYGFCITCAPMFVVWIAFSTLAAYTLARLMGRASGDGWRKALLTMGIVNNLGMLFTLKYLGFATETLQALFDTVNLSYPLPALNLLLPLGISFYTLQSTGYLIDVHRRKIEPEKHLGYFALYMAFFPKLASGPFESVEHLIPQFRKAHNLDTSRLFSGLQLILWGMFKKVVIADRLAIYVTEVYGNPNDYLGWTVAIAILFSAAHIYADFSGYSDIAVGVARLFDIDVTQNFRQPYLATSVSDFWRRWHISFSSWLRDYVYIPLGGNRVPRWRRDMNIFIVFLVSGLWHGAAWTFVLWGALHGAYIVLERRTQNVRAWVAKVMRLESHTTHRAIGTAITFVVVTFAWVFFYARSVPDALLMIRNMFYMSNWADSLVPWTGITSTPVAEMALAWGLLGMLALVHLARDGRLPHLTTPVTSKAAIRWAVYLLLGLAIMNLGVANELPFLYAGF